MPHPAHVGKASPRREGGPFTADTYIALLMQSVATGVLVCFPVLAPAVGLQTRFDAMNTLPGIVACALTVVVGDVVCRGIAITIRSLTFSSGKLPSARRRAGYPFPNCDCENSELIIIAPQPFIRAAIRIRALCYYIVKLRRYVAQQ